MHRGISKGIGKFRSMDDILDDRTKIELEEVNRFQGEAPAANLVPRKTLLLNDEGSQPRAGATAGCGGPAGSGPYHDHVVIPFHGGEPRKI